MNEFLPINCFCPVRAVSVGTVGLPHSSPSVHRFTIAGNSLLSMFAAGIKRKKLTPAARRALKEAEQRRQADKAAAQPPEHGGRKGPEPTRYGDWEKKGIVSDF